MGYKVTAQLPIDLSEFGTDKSGNPFFAKLQHPKLMTRGQEMELAKIAPAPKKKEIGPDGKEIEPEVTEEEKLKNIEKTIEMTNFIQSFLRSWNLIDVETEEPVDYKSKDAFDHVPGEVVTKIFLEFIKARNQKSEETKNSSQQ